MIAASSEDDCGDGSGSKAWANNNDNNNAEGTMSA